MIYLFTEDNLNGPQYYFRSQILLTKNQIEAIQDLV